MVKRKIFLMLTLVCAVTIVTAQTRKSKYPKKKKSSYSNVNNSSVQNSGFPKDTIPKTTSIPTVSEKVAKKPIYSIFQENDESKAKRELDLNKDSIKCAPEYPRVKKEDVVFARRLKRDIYFAEESNKFLVPKSAEQNLLYVLLNAVKENKIDAYQTWNDNSNTLIDLINYTDLMKKTDTYAGLADLTQAGESPGLRKKAGLRLIEDWYFDRNRSEFKPYIIAIGLIVPSAAQAVDVNNLFGAPNMPPNPTKLDDPSVKVGEAGSGMVALFYVNYPTIREELCKSKVFHPNSVINYSFDDIFQLRYFSSLIIEERNADGTRIGDMKDEKGKNLTGLDKLLEADRAKKSLMQYEQDMWSY
jgi:gliding motility associated protien GldN